MIYIFLQGRIGNNLFQIATGASLAHKYKTDFCLYPGAYFAPEPDNCMLLDYLKQFETNILRNTKIVTIIPDNILRYKERDFTFDEIPFSENMLIEGFFQSEKYFESNFIHQLYEIDSETKKYIDKKYGKLFDEEITSINVRRGDFFKHLDNHPICSLRYFRNAIRFIGSNKKYLIISDDIEWCKKKFKGGNFTFVQNESPVVDLYLQTYCANNIISNSSFSWWGAWLNENPNKIVICPTPWFGVALQTKNTKDLYPKSWIIIKNSMPFHQTIYGYALWIKKRVDYFFRK